MRKHGSKYFARRPLPHTLGMGSTGQKSTFSEHGHVATCLFCCFTSQVNSYGHGGAVSSPNHTFSWTSLNKQKENKWLRFAGVLSKHIDAQGFQQVELVSSIDAQGFQRVELVSSIDAQGFQRVELVSSIDAQGFQRVELVSYIDARGFQRVELVSYNMMPKGFSEWSW